MNYNISKAPSAFYIIGLHSDFSCFSNRYDKSFLACSKAISWIDRCTHPLSIFILSIYESDSCPEILMLFFIPWTEKYRYSHLCCIPLLRNYFLEWKNQLISDAICKVRQPKRLRPIIPFRVAWKVLNWRNRFWLCLKIWKGGNLLGSLNIIESVCYVCWLNLHNVSEKCNVGYGKNEKNRNQEYSGKNPNDCAGDDLEFGRLFILFYWFIVNQTIQWDDNLWLDSMIIEISDWSNLTLCLIMIMFWLPIILIIRHILMWIFVHADIW